MSSSDNIIILFPHPPASGGPGTFQGHFEHVAKNNNIQIVYGISNILKADIVFVVAGTKKIILLMLAKLLRVPIIHRLDGINWNQNAKGFPLLMKLKQDVRNLLMLLTRNIFASTVIYQSEYVRNLWDDRFGVLKKDSAIIYNGTDLSIFSNGSSQCTKEGPLSIICVEGEVQPNEYYVEIFKLINDDFMDKGIVKSIKVVGRVSSEYKAKFDKIPDVEFLGVKSRAEMPSLYNSNHIFFCLEINPPCPNSVVEALASGLPVIGYNTGSLSELVGSIETLSDYGKADSFSGEKPEVDSIVSALNFVIKNYDSLSLKARERAENNFCRDIMVRKYLEKIKEVI